MARNIQNHCWTEWWAQCGFQLECRTCIKEWWSVDSIEGTRWIMIWCYKSLIFYNWDGFMIPPRFILLPYMKSSNFHWLSTVQKWKSLLPTLHLYYPYTTKYNLENANWLFQGVYSRSAANFPAFSRFSIPIK